MAIEAGVDKEIVKEIIFNEGKNLPHDLKEIYDFTLTVVNKDIIEPGLYDRINEKYSKDILTELALAIASTKVFPSIKRVLNDFHSCSVIKLKV